MINYYAEMNIDVLFIIIKLVTENSPNPFYVFVFFSTGWIYFRSKLSARFERVQVFQGNEDERFFIFI